jgi:hypothetical protein
VLADQGSLRQGRNDLVVEFRSATRGDLVDVGEVHLMAAMTMPGMPMAGDTAVAPACRPGRYRVTAAFPMAGAWRLVIAWNGPAGTGSVTFDGDAR